MKKLLALLLAAAMTASLAACGGASSGSQAPSSEAAPSGEASSSEAASGEADAAGTADYEKETIQIAALKGPTAIGMLQMMEDAQKGEAPDDYQFTLAGSADEIVGRIVQGEFDIAAVPTNLAAVLYNRAEGRVQLGALNTLGVLYMLENGQTIQSVADLAGKTVHTISKGSVPEYVLNYVLAQNGLDPQTDLTVEYHTESTEVAALLAAGEAQVAMLPQPFVTSVLTQNDQVRVALDMTEEWDKVGDGSVLTMGCIVVQKDFAQNHPEAMARFLEAYDQSVAWVTDEANLEEAAALCESFDIMNAAVAQQAIPECNIVFITGDEMEEKVGGFLQVLYDADPSAVGGAMPDEAFYYKG
ncbi:MAG TPA: ABC transporter substrate-binding protein [Firmicutes bacterium]|nr:ABC transporter substrate-binding protein [Bacillota bacterium]